MQIPLQTFFYGGLMNRRIMANLGIAPRPQIVAALSGYEIDFHPLVNLRPAFGSVAFGVLMDFDHQALAEIYAKLKVRYDPYPVSVQLRDGAMVSALTYICPTLTGGPADQGQVAAVLEASEALALPAAYIATIRSFLA